MLWRTTQSDIKRAAELAKEKGELAVAVKQQRSLWKAQAAYRIDTAHLPDTFIVFALETTGLNPDTDEIIEIGAMRVHRISDKHEAIQVLVKPSQKIPKKTTGLTGISQEMVDAEGQPIEDVLKAFVEFIGDLRLVSYDAEFNMAFLYRAADRYSISINNPVSCALKMSRRAWPRRKSFRLLDMAKEINLNVGDSRRTLGDCLRVAGIYLAAARELKTVD